MRFREWSEEENERAAGGDEGGDADGTLEEVRRRGEMLLARAADALRKVESGESERFMNAVLQQGGQ